MTARSPSPPRHLSAEAKALHRRLVADYSLIDAPGLAILGAGLEAFDRMRAAQAEITRDGATFRDRFGQIQVHPAVRIERDSRAAWLAALKQLNFDLEPLRPGPGRPAGSIAIPKR